MDISSSEVEAVTVSDILDLATWNRPRTSDELRSFVESRHAALPDELVIE